ncbi:hypothetical protein V8G54_025658 [Vigna mungo]|uniref:Uncharacterized protein n=1 Tax=Vigna mungo TaxID=3915 RepID=A0AAQ3RLC1_VIGMU
MTHLIKTPTKSVLFLQKLRKKFPRCSIRGIDFDSLDTAATCFLLLWFTATKDYSTAYDLGWIVSHINSISFHKKPAHELHLQPVLLQSGPGKNRTYTSKFC